jgi:glutamate-ammonia-ligase adenylyltransferase
MAPNHDDIARRCSPYLDIAIRRHPDWFESLRNLGRLETTSPPDASQLLALVEEMGLDPALRIFRDQEMMRIIWRELNRRGALEETFRDLSLLAESCLETAARYHANALTARHGTPRDSEGKEQRLVVIGMGKLGGQELNLSSDIDLVFCYPATGACDGSRGLSNEQFFTRLTRQIIRSLSEVSEYGFCFRVDTRLRPFGESGPLVCSFGAMEQYYQREGRDWERYALIKARPVAGDRPAGQELLNALRPFVYRRYIDFGAVEALQEMHTAVRQDAADRGREQDIKRGPGGIREIEFIVQAYQLLRGGREPRLRTPSILPALDGLVELHLMQAKTAQCLRGDYAFLRRLENAIQALHDQQTHVLPAGEDLGRVALAMGFEDTPSLLAEVDRVRSEVGRLFRDHLQASEPSPPDAAWSERWRALQSSGSDAGGIDPVPARFLERLARQSLSQRAAQRLDRFMPLLLEQLDRLRPPSAALADVLELVLAITRRSAYLELLVRNPAALDRMLGLFGKSDWIAQTVIRHPALLDELIDPTLGQHPPGPGDIGAAADRILRSHEDAEATLLALNHLKLATHLRVAVAELETTLPAGQAKLALTQLAEAVVRVCLQLSGEETAQRHAGGPEDSLCVIGYGSLGAGELGYGSDLDLIFLYEGGSGSQEGLPRERFYTQVARRLLSLLATPTPSGKLYTTDTRLRPNGRAGLLVSSLAAFKKYQLEKAWTWELQALTRARALCGNEQVAERFRRIRRAALSRPLEHTGVREQVLAMRQRMRAEFGGKDALKHGPGGLIDIDFIAQLGVLECAAAHPEVLEPTGTPGQLNALARAGWLRQEQAEVLCHSHELLSRTRHLLSIARGGVGEKADLKPSQAACAAILGDLAAGWFSTDSASPGSISGTPGKDHSG